MKDDALVDKFGLTPLANFEVVDTPDDTVPVVELNEEPSEIDQALQDAADDFADIRNRIKHMLEKAEDVFESSYIVASTSQNEKDISAFAKILDSVTKTGKELMSMHKDAYSLKPQIIDVAPQQANTINNIVFQGNGADSIEYLKSKQLEDNSKKD